MKTIQLMWSNITNAIFDNAKIYLYIYLFIIEIVHEVHLTN